MTETKKQEVLCDKSATGRKRPWAQHRTSCEYLAVVYEDISIRKAERVRDCATTLTFSATEEGMTLANAWFCRVRLCPMCSWRRSLKVGAQMNEIMAEIAKKHKYSYIMLTLTMRNVEGDKLSDAIDLLMGAFERLTRRKRVKDAAKGWYRAVEITHNLKENTYHPHIHAVIAVTSTYFGQGYIRHDEWIALWREALRVDYDPVVDVRRVKGTTAAAVAEVAKYAVKPGDYIVPDDWDLTIETVELLDEVLANRRLIGYGGIFKEMHRKLKMDTPEEGDLVHINGEAPSKPGERLITFVWYSGYRQYISD